jgi:acetylornithine deacetylase/succinyl-diaminopimelate desuccinylase-like protein
VPVIIIGPSGDRIHSDDERVSRKSLENIMKLYEAIFSKQD